MASLPLFENLLYTRTHYFLNIQPIPLQEETIYFGLLFPQPLYPTGNGSHLSPFGFPSPQGSLAMLGDIWMVITLGREDCTGI